jgi:hypothetical protein
MSMREHSHPALLYNPEPSHVGMVGVGEACWVDRPSCIPKLFPSSNTASVQFTQERLP